MENSWNLIPEFGWKPCCNQWAYSGSCADFNDLLRPAFMTYATLRKKNKLGPVQFTRPTVSGLYDITRAKINGFYVIL